MDNMNKWSQTHFPWGAPLTNDEFLDIPVYPEYDDDLYIRAFMLSSRKNVAMPTTIIRCSDIVDRKLRRDKEDWNNHEALALLSVGYHVGQMHQKAFMNRQKDD